MRCIDQNPPGCLKWKPPPSKTRVMKARFRRSQTQQCTAWLLGALQFRRVCNLELGPPAPLNNSQWKVRCQRRCWKAGMLNRELPKPTTRICQGERPAFIFFIIMCSLLRLLSAKDVSVSHADGGYSDSDPLPRERYHVAYASKQPAVYNLALSKTKASTLGKDQVQEHAEKAVWVSAFSIILLLRASSRKCPAHEMCCTCCILPEPVSSESGLRATGNRGVSQGL